MESNRPYKLVIFVNQQIFSFASFLQLYYNWDKTFYRCWLIRLFSNIYFRTIVPNSYRRINSLGPTKFFRYKNHEPEAWVNRYITKPSHALWCPSQCHSMHFKLVISLLLFSSWLSSTLNCSLFPPPYRSNGGRLISKKNFRVKISKS